MGDPLISIITPTWNSAVSLPVMLDSVRTQTMQPCEHIIVDNVSHDNTKEIVDAYRVVVPYPVHFICEKDKGIYSAMNKGIIKSSGEWIHILNSDDRYASNRALAQAFDRELHDCELIACSIEVCYCDEFIRISQAHIDENGECRFPHPGNIIHNFFYKRVGFYNDHYKIAADLAFNLRHFSLARYVISDQILVSMASTGISSHPSLRHWCERSIVTILHRHLPMIKKIRMIIYDAVDQVRQAQKEA